MVPLIRLVPLTLALLGQTDPKEQARQFLDSCQAGKFTEATANFDAKMTEVLGPAKLEELWKKLGQQLGPIEKMGPPRTDKIGSSTRVKIRCDFKTMPLDALVSFNAQGQIEGFFLNAAERTADTPDPSYVEKSKFTEEAITVGARDWPLPGTLSRPRGVASAPLVIRWPELSCWPRAAVPSRRACAKSSTTSGASIATRPKKWARSRRNWMTPSCE